jgi:hypothetical protein
MKIFKLFAEIYVIFSFIYILSFIFHSYKILNDINNGKFNNYAYVFNVNNTFLISYQSKYGYKNTSISMNEIMYVFILMGLITSIIMFSRIILSFTINYINRHINKNIFINILCKVLIILEFITHVEFILCLFTYNAICNIVFEFQLYSNPNGIKYIYGHMSNPDGLKITYQPNHYEHEYNLLLKNYIGMLFISHIISTINLTIGSPFKNYVSLCGSKIHSNKTTYDKDSFCSVICHYFYLRIYSNNDTYYSSYIHSLNLFDYFSYNTDYESLNIKNYDSSKKNKRVHFV